MYHIPNDADVLEEKGSYIFYGEGGDKKGRESLFCNRRVKWHDQ